MNKDLLLKQYLRSRSFGKTALKIALCGALMIFPFYRHEVFSKFYNAEFFYGTLCILFLTAFLNFVLLIKCILQTRKDIEKFRSGEFEVVEDVIADKFKKGLIFDKTHFVVFKKRDHFSKEVPVSRKDYKRLSIGQTVHYLIIRGSKKQASCFVEPNGKK